MRKERYFMRGERMFEANYVYRRSVFFHSFTG